MKRSDTLGWSQVKTGIFIIIALILFASGVLLMGQKTKMFVPKGQISLIMTNVVGLKVGAPVWLAGVDVGVVREIHFATPSATNEVEIILEVEKSALTKVGRDSRITIKTRGLMGEKYVDITPSQLYGAVPETRVYGSSVNQLDDVMQKAGAAFDRLNGIMDKMDKGEGSLGRFMHDTKLYDNLNHLTIELNTLATTVNRGEGTLGKLTRSNEPYERMIAILSRAEATLKDIQSADGTMGRLVRDRQLYDKLVTLAERSIEAADDVRELNRKLTSKESTIGKLLGERELYDKSVNLVDRADSAVKAFEDVAVRLHGTEGTAGRLLNDREVYDKLNRMVENVDLLVKDIKENPKRYVKFSLF
jgi:phospholipid/cholesterol/gamma-HCH transport system substrate-binding protein